MVLVLSALTGAAFGTGVIVGLAIGSSTVASASAAAAAIASPDQEDHTIAIKTLHDLANGRGFHVTIRQDGLVEVMPVVMDGALINAAVIKQLTGSLEQAFHSGEVGGFCIDEETGDVEPVAGYAVVRRA
jgi:hypothetical protein